jgi:hypothetical protein
MNSTNIIDVNELKTTDLVQLLGIVTVGAGAIVQVVQVIVNCVLKVRKNKSARKALDIIMSHYSPSNEALNDNVDELTR